MFTNRFGVLIVVFVGLTIALVSLSLSTLPNSVARLADRAYNQIEQLGVNYQNYALFLDHSYNAIERLPARRHHTFLAR